jgi:putative transposase
MKASKFTNAQKAFILRQGEDGMPVAEICQMAGISQATYFNWKEKYGGLLPDTHQCTEVPAAEQNQPRPTVATSRLYKKGTQRS